MTEFFALLILGISICAFLVGWSAASVYWNNYWRKKWNEMSLRAAELDRHAKELSDKYDDLVGRNVALLKKIDGICVGPPR